MLKCKKSHTFTLAEVLITLGIVGIVAAITLPNLLMTIQGNKYRNQFKKTLSTLNQAARSAQAHYDLDFAALNETCQNGGSDNPDQTHSLCAVFNATLKGARYLGDSGSSLNPEPNVYDCAIAIGSGNLGYMYYYQLSDGSIVGFHHDLKDCKLPDGSHAVTEDMLKNGGALANCVGFIDVNGTSGPNELVQGEPVNTSSFNFHRLLDRVAFDYNNIPAFASEYGDPIIVPEYGDPIIVPVPSGSNMERTMEGYSKQEYQQYCEGMYNHWLFNYNLGCEERAEIMSGDVGVIIQGKENPSYYYYKINSDEYCLYKEEETLRDNDYCWNISPNCLTDSQCRMGEHLKGNFDIDNDEYQNDEYHNPNTDHEESSDKCASDVFDPQATCNVPNKRHYINDIFPIVFHDGVVEPASGPARNVLYTAK